ncbi:uncharacterized protein (DUF779 family) [Azospirillum fermentarium]|uniref:DUF779 domain-containing protein n=1 Tax=Azospirillum fermentarium TaxID=1233114 RepID=UPI002227BD03|nr:DUF779 domain-containing protein [Azospirillum fermentarium]MCW2249346.1 uncharacterized protein (DUF779 family) [Azospirillum fermentarium]
MTIARVTVSPAAAALIGRLSAVHGPLIFHLSGGCCDGSAPLCLPADGFRLGGRDLRVGEAEGAPFYMADDVFAYWEHSQVLLDVVESRSGGFSLEAPDGVRFIARARLFTDAELPDVARPRPALA